MLKTLSRFAIRFGLIPVAVVILRLYFLLIRVRSVHEEAFRTHLNSGDRAIAALWHQRILIVMGYARHFGDFCPSVMISRSRDGEMIADVYRRINFRPVRGSSSSGGREALAAMVADLETHPFAVHILDGPRGPRGVVKAGLIRMAQLSGAPIVPVYISINRAWCLNSWDRFLIPKPFSTVTVRWDKPIAVPADLDESAFEALRRGIEKQMRDQQEIDDRKQGWPASLLE
jgi:lysophospholipid acyltransferase (LPLAT)-like uncharacterized protein